MTRAEKDKAIGEAMDKGGSAAVMKLRRKWKKEAAEKKRKIEEGKTLKSRDSSSDLAVSRTKKNIDKGRSAALNTLLTVVPGGFIVKGARFAGKVFKTRKAAEEAAKKLKPPKSAPKSVAAPKSKPKAAPKAVVKPKPKAAPKKVKTPPPARGMKVRPRKPEPKPEAEVVNPNAALAQGRMGTGPRKLVTRPRPKQKPKPPAVASKPPAVVAKPPAVRKPTSPRPKQKPKPPSLRGSASSPKTPPRKSRRPNPLAAIPPAIANTPTPKPPKKRAKDEVFDTDLVATASKKLKKPSSNIDNDFFDTPSGVTKKKSTTKSKKNPHWREIKKVSDLLGVKYEVPKLDNQGLPTDPDMREASLVSDSTGGLLGRKRKATKVKIKKKPSTKKKYTRVVRKSRGGFMGKGAGCAKRGY
jgi:hypothetical protein